jgi:predicted XRE-type DNA-binding protein
MRVTTLQAWMKRERHNQCTLAPLLGISQAHLSRLMAGHLPWTMPLALRAVLVTGLPVERFLSRADAGILKIYVNRLRSGSDFPKENTSVA